MTKLKGSLKRMDEILKGSPVRARHIKSAKPKEEDKLAGAKCQGQAQFDSIKEMVEAVQAAEAAIEVTRGTRDGLGGAGTYDAAEAAQRTIQEDALSVLVRSGWYPAGAGQAEQKPAEYEILLCTGGPACRIIGELNQHGEPETARLEVQDWFQPWTAMRPVVTVSSLGVPLGSRGGADNYDSEPIMLEYARCFYFGEG